MVSPAHSDLSLKSMLILYISIKRSIIRQGLACGKDVWFPGAEGRVDGHYWVPAPGL